MKLLINKDLQHISHGGYGLRAVSYDNLCYIFYYSISIQTPISILKVYYMGIYSLYCKLMNNLRLFTQNTEKTLYVNNSL